ncbi:hypothetical protein EYF80_017360 [Liparis tanakae]|uniref:Uncharacterized protein n=1 Tax=Liparis tanakae TaxID=230148 RepID=A0A4Z2I561_9TELE|nr:hypothetical protein EYF80_017360 [Liparis tanakae]
MNFSCRKANDKPRQLPLVKETRVTCTHPGVPLAQRPIPFSLACMAATQGDGRAEVAGKEQESGQDEAKG